MAMPLTRRSLLAGLSLLSAAPLLAQDLTVSDPPADPMAGLIGDPRVGYFDIEAGEAAWRIHVGMPKAPPPSQGYSAIVALDGRKLFPIFWEARESIAPDAPVILIGITYPAGSRRWLDLTSPAMATLSGQEGAWRAPVNRITGGREGFLQMIATRLLPELRESYSLNLADVTLYGHSLGGLFALYALFAQPELFTNYVAADPSVWWNYGEPLREAEAFAGGIRAAGGQVSPSRRLLMARAGSVAGGGKVGARLIDPSLMTTLSQINGLEVLYRLYPDRDHGSIIAPSVAAALALHLGQRIE